MDGRAHLRAAVWRMAFCAPADSSLSTSSVPALGGVSRAMRCGPEDIASDACMPPQTGFRW